MPNVPPDVECNAARQQDYVIQYHEQERGAVSGLQAPGVCSFSSLHCKHILSFRYHTERVIAFWGVDTAVKIRKLAMFRTS